MEIGCGKADLLASLEPRVGIGVDFSSEMLKQAKAKHPNLLFVQAEAHALPFAGIHQLDAVILSDLINDLWDILAAFKELHRVMGTRTRLYLNSYSRLWEPVLSLASRLKLAKPNLPQNWVTVEDIDNFFELADFQRIRRWQEVLFPFSVPAVAAFFNKFLVRFWPFKHLALTNFIAARKMIDPTMPAGTPSVAIVIPARNEAGNIPEIFRRIPDLSGSMELIFVEGHSRDETYITIEREIEAHPEISSSLLKQHGEGKGDAVREGFAEASGDVLMILDADLSVQPEDLEVFYEAVASGRVEFANGVRLVYPMESRAMRFFNLLGNKLFGAVFSWLLGQSVRDTLCGTKALWREDYQRIARNREYFGDFDPFGDFDLLLGAAKLDLKIVDIPVRYYSRRYGSTNISRWRHGMLLLRMTMFAARRLKFV